MNKIGFVEALLGIKIHFIEGVHVIFPPCQRKFHLRVTALHNGEDVFNGEIQCQANRPVEFASRQKYYIPWEIEIKQNDQRVYLYRMNLTGREVCVNLSPGTLGDMIAWFTATLNFATEHNCHLTVMMRQPYIEMFESAYPEVRFVAPQTDLAQFYASYPIAVEGYGNSDYCVADFQKVNLIDYSAFTLGIQPDHTPPELAPMLQDFKSQYERYVCIATRASRKMKQWNNPGAWEKVTQFLKDHGYRVFCIDADNDAMPPNAEDFTGMLPLRQRIDLIRGCEFMIGFSSGLSWISWAMEKPTVLISGFSLEYTEFSTPYRIIDKSVCHGCLNTGDMRFNEFDKCVNNKDYECTRVITPERVIEVIKTIPEFQREIAKSEK